MCDLDAKHMVSRLSLGQTFMGSKDHMIDDWYGSTGYSLCHLPLEFTISRTDGVLCKKCVKALAKELDGGLKGTLERLDSGVV